MSRKKLRGPRGEAGETGYNGMPGDRGEQGPPGETPSTWMLWTVVGCLCVATGFNTLVLWIVTKEIEHWMEPVRVVMRALN